MTKQQFIEKMATYLQKYGPSFGMKCVSGPLAQCCLESAYGTSELAVSAQNYFGLKYNPQTPNRCPSASGVYTKVGSEQKSDGSYISYEMLWQKFSDMEHCSKGFYEFLANGYGRYDNLKGITDPQKWLETIKADGYCTSLNYVQNCMNVVNTYNLTKYDTKETTMKYTNSFLVNYTRISPNKTVNRNHVIDTITIHHMAGNLTIETCGNVFAPASRQASSNYGIGSDGRIGMYVEEKDRSWASSNAANDHRAITIEVADDVGAPNWHISDKAMDSLIKLCADICKRNGIKKLVWSANKSDRINHRNGCNMTVHRDFASTSCPSDYLYNKHGYIADEVNKLLGVSSNYSGGNVTPTPQPVQTPINFVGAKLTITKGDPAQFSTLIKNLEKSMNYDYKKQGINLNMPEDGIIDNALLTHLSNTVLTISNATKFENVVYTLQQLMAWWGFVISPNGYFDATTQDVIKYCQKAWNIPITGTTTKDFWYKLLGK